MSARRSLVAPPLVTNDRRNTRLEGPALAAAKHTEVVFSTDGPSLAGMLFVPAGEGSFPAAVVFHGSGTSRRDYLTVATHLQDNGVAVLLPDKRGCEKSQGDWTKASFADLAGGAVAAIAFVRDQKYFTCSGQENRRIRSGAALANNSHISIKVYPRAATALSLLEQTGFSLLFWRT